MGFRTYIKGRVGELLNRLGQRLLLPRKDYHSFHNIIVPTRHGTAEVDHLLVSKFGIFVIEAKHWSGWLFGTEREKTWTRVHFHDRRQIRNPLLQNYGHVMALSELLELPPSRFRPLVAIRGATFKTLLPAGVVLGGYAHFVRRFRCAEFSNEEVARIVTVLSSDRVGKGFMERLRHAFWTKARHAD